MIKRYVSLFSIFIFLHKFNSPNGTKNSKLTSKHKKSSYLFCDVTDVSFEAQDYKYVVCYTILLRNKFL